MAATMRQFSPTLFPAPVVRTRIAGDFAMTETRYGGGSSLTMHSHQYACLVVVLSGTFHERFDVRERIGEPGMVIVRPEGEPHADRCGAGGGRCLNIELAPRWLARVSEQAPVVDTSRALTGAAFAELGRRMHEELVHGDDLSALAVESLVLATIADAARESRRAATTPPRWLLEAKTLMHDRFNERLTLELIAAAAGVHPVHLATTFRRYFGQTVARYLRTLRLDYARQALVTSDTSLTEVAYAAGFADQSHFCRLFRQATRMTPAQYRIAMRGNPSTVPAD
jgi:AraC family transcriptional regulator